ncbi:hypothetical protein [Haladaptatus sp. ZSTT2]|uniref:hypothetical protein n=1 Tax=Haladaptatus sp. ZSTT2 TaxID=3120515 RepID=UPI00300F2126
MGGDQLTPPTERTVSGSDNSFTEILERDLRIDRSGEPSDRLSQRDDRLGLVGWNRATVSDSEAGGRGTGSEFVGGLVGRNDETVCRSKARGSVSGDTNVGDVVCGGNPAQESYPARAAPTVAPHSTPLHVFGACSRRAGHTLCMLHIAGGSD